MLGLYSKFGKSTKRGSNEAIEVSALESLPAIVQIFCDYFLRAWRQAMQCVSLMMVVQ